MIDQNQIENLVQDEIKSWGWDVEIVSDVTFRNLGFHIKFRSPQWKNYYTGRVKFLRPDGTSMVWQTDVTAVGPDRIFFVNPVTKYLAWCGMDDIRKWLGSADEATLDIKDKSITFLKRRKIEQK